MKRPLMVLVVALALVSAACGASGDDGASGEDDGDVTTTTAAAADSAVFGEMDEAVCGEGDFSVDPDEAGGSPDVLRIGVAGDRSSDIRPGLNKDMWDSSVAFAAWCNEQGGIGGLPIEIVDLDAALFNVEAAMTTACTSDWKRRSEAARCSACNSAAMASRSMPSAASVARCISASSSPAASVGATTP